MNAFPKSRTRVQGWIKGRLGFMAMLLVSAGAATGQTTEGSVTLNFRDADFTEVVEAVSAATGKSFIIDPRIHARVTMIAATKVSSAAFYEAFLSLLPVCGLVAKTDGNVITILPDPKAEGFIRVGLPDLSGRSPVARWAQ
jgi:type II secretory pathway component GspD/PulD (secretin)